MADIQNKIRINKAYKPLYTNKDARYHLILGGRGSLKSSSVMDFLVRLTYESGHGILLTRYTLKSAGDSIIPGFIEAVDRMGLGADFHITGDKGINKKTGSFVLFRGINTNGADQTASLKSIVGITTWVIEEAEDFKSEAKFNLIDDSIRANHRQNRVIFIMNPTTREHWIFQKWLKNHNKQIDVEGFKVTVSTHPDVCCIHTTWRIADKLGYLASGWVKKAKSSLQELNDKIEETKKDWTKSEVELQNEIHNLKHNSHYYYNYCGGWLVRKDGVIFDNWIEGEFDRHLPYVYGLDFGYNPDPLAVIKVAVDKRRKRIYVKEMVYETEVDEIEKAFERAGVTKRSLIVADTNENRTLKRLQKSGYNIKKAIKNLIAEDIREIKTYLIVVDPKSMNLKSEFNNYSWNDKKSDLPNDEWNHACDAMRYGFRRLVKRRIGVRSRN